MIARRTIAGVLGSVGVHVALLVAVGERSPIEPPLPPPPDELVAITVLGSDPPTPQHATPIEPASIDDAPAPPPGEPIPPPDPIASAPAPSAEPRPREPDPEPASDPEPAPEPAPQVAEPAPQVAELAPAPSDEDAPPSPDEGDEADPPGPRTPSAGRVGGTGSASPTAHGRGTFDTSGYGEEIVAIVKEELASDPVPGIRSTDSIRLVLRVKPNGSLAWIGSGRFGFAQVLSTTLGPVRTRAVLKRFERGSWRFPAYPEEMQGRRRWYEMELTLRFTRSLARR